MSPRGSWHHSGRGQDAVTRHPHRSTSLILLVFVGGMAGTLSRVALNGLIATPQGWPLPTLTINLCGSFLLGFLLEALLRTGPDSGRRRKVRLLAGTGFLGGFTTYSAFALETVQLGAGGSFGAAAGYAAASVLGGVLLCFAGIALATVLTRRRFPDAAGTGTR